MVRNKALASLLPCMLPLLTQGEAKPTGQSKVLDLVVFPHERVIQVGMMTDLHGWLGSGRVAGLHGSSPALLFSFGKWDTILASQRSIVRIK